MQRRTKWHVYPYMTGMYMVPHKQPTCVPESEEWNRSYSEIVLSMAMHRDSAEHEFVTLPLANPPKLPSKAENRQNEQEKRTYDERVREVEHGTFPPCRFALWQQGPIATVVYRRIASLTTEKLSCVSEVHAYPSTTQPDLPRLESPST